MIVDRVLVDRVGVRGRWQQHGQNVGLANGDSPAVRPGNAPGGSRSAPALCLGHQGKQGGAPGTVVRQGRANGTCGCGQRQAKAKQMAGY